MSCPTCDHTMQLLYMDSLRTMHVCPRCGTIRDQMGPSVDLIVPALVERCRKFEEEAQQGQVNINDWIIFGIAEAIHKPEERPT